MDGLIPTRYVNITATVAYSADLPDPLFRTYVRLVGLAWRDREHRYTHLPILSLAELADVCHLKSRAMRLHLHDLEKHNLITCEGGKHALTIRIRDPEPVQSFAAVQSFARPLIDDHGNHDVVDGFHSREISSTSNHGSVQSFAPQLAALAEFGVDVSLADTHAVAALPHVTPEFVRAWGTELAQRADTRNLPGRLLYKLRTTQRPPRVETRGGDHTSKAPTQQTQSHLPTLPDAVHRDLDLLGFIGPRDEVATLFAENADFVHAWLAHSLRNAARLRNPVGYFRTAIRGELFPPEAEVVQAAAPPKSEPATPSAAEVLWKQVLAQLRLQMLRATFEAWLQDSRALRQEDGALVVQVKNQCAVAWLEGRLSKVVARAVGLVAGEGVGVRFVVE